MTLRKDIPQHLGIRPGDRIELDLLPDGRGVIKAARSEVAMDEFVGLLAGPTDKVATMNKINAAIKQAWARA